MSLGMKGFSGKVKIAIVGSGISGLACARKLYREGFNNVTIFESKPFVGGRTRTIQLDGAKLEIGAQWIHGQVGNKIYDLAKERSLLDSETSGDEPFHENLDWPFSMRGHSDLIFKTLHFLDVFVGEADELFYRGTNTDASTISFGHFIRDKFERHLREQNYGDVERRVAEVCFDWFVRLQNEIQGSVCLSDVSTKLLRHYHECEGNLLTELSRKGFAGVLDVILEEIPKEWIRNGCRVKRISTSSNASSCPVEVVLENGENMSFDHVICTVPLGVLKKFAGVLFSPSLPEKHLKAIRCLGFGAIGKIFLVYDSKEALSFFPKDRKVIAGWTDGKTYRANTMSKDMSKDFEPWMLSQNSELSNTWFRYINRFEVPRFHSRVLCVWIGGDGAAYMDRLDDHQVAEGCLKVLSLLLGRGDIPKPSDIIRSKWFSDPDTLGSYTFHSTDCEREGVLTSDLAEPVYGLKSDPSYPTVLFAGEATSLNFYSTVHGAFETGEREADRISNFYRNTGVSSLKAKL